MILPKLLIPTIKQRILRKANIPQNTKPNSETMEKISSTSRTFVLNLLYRAIFRMQSIHVISIKFSWFLVKKCLQIATNKNHLNTFRCITTQVDRDGRTILYTKTETIKLHVEKLIIPPPVSLTQKIGIISAVLLAIIFLILCCVFILFALCKKRRRQKRSRYLMNINDLMVTVCS